MSGLLSADMRRPAGNVGERSILLPSLTGFGRWLGPRALRTMSLANACAGTRLRLIPPKRSRGLMVWCRGGRPLV